jgi:hypothetical protein
MIRNTPEPAQKHHYREPGDDEGGVDAAGVEREKTGSGRESET